MLLGPANFSAKQPRITHKFRSRRGVRRNEYDIISATSRTESFVGNGLSSNSNVITLGPIGCSIGTTRIKDFTNCIHPFGLSVMSCSWTCQKWPKLKSVWIARIFAIDLISCDNQNVTIELGGSGSLSTIVPITLSVSLTSRSTVSDSDSSHRSMCLPYVRP